MSRLPDPLASRLERKSNPGGDVALAHAPVMGQGAGWSGPHLRYEDSHAYLAPILTGTVRVRYQFLTVLWLVGAAWFWGWWLDPAKVIEPWRYALLTLLLGWIFFLQVFFLMMMHRSVRPVSADPRPGQHRVAMVVTKAPSEPFSVVRRTLEAMLAQDYPHDTWLADEDPQPETEAWCEAHGVKISTRRGRADYHRTEWPRRTRCKEGNLAFFYDHWGYAEYDIVSQLDSDHVPQPGYLVEMLRPFADPQVGYVSAPSICSANAQEHWVARTRLDTEAAFHGILQAGYSNNLAPMCIGSHYAVRTEALRSVGGLGPELAEDHSTTLMLNAGGWRGVHALDAIAYGDGPATVADLVTQEFQWSRSLMTLLIGWTPRHLKTLPPRLKAQFLFCQLLYPITGIAMAVMFALPIVSLVFDIRFADVTYPGFVAHTLPPMLALLLIAWMLRRDGLYRPVNGKVIGWEKVLFILLQWPWVAWGCMMAVRDAVSGRFVEFRITPKGEAASKHLPMKVVGVYATLAAACLLPILMVEGVGEARGFYLLAFFSGILYTITVAVIVLRHLAAAAPWESSQLVPAALQLATVAALSVMLVMSANARGIEGLHALAIGLEPLRLTRTEYTASGAGQGISVRFRLDPRWN